MPPIFVFVSLLASVFVYQLVFEFALAEDASLLVKWIRFRCTLRRLPPSLQLYSRLTQRGCFTSLQFAAITIRVGRSCSTGLARIYMCVGANADINSNTNTDIITNLDEQKWIQVFWSNLQSSYGEKGDLLDFGSKHWPLGCYWCTTQIIFVLYQFLSQ